jgi:HSP20 family molecular chaperone IbpA
MAEAVKKGNGGPAVREPAEKQNVMIPLADVRETGDELVVEMDLPGVKVEDLDVHFDRGELTVRARGSNFPAGVRSWLALEYQPGDYERSFRLSPEIDASKIGADLKNGVLTLRLPKAETSKTRKIAVKGE